MSKLVILESPSKAKTVKKYLGQGYEVVASMGHIRDLPKSKIAIDIENGFTPKYVEMPDKKEIIADLRKKAKSSEYVYLAADPDREGEAISWHLQHILGLSEDEYSRVTFNEITKNAVLAGMESPRKIDMDLVDAQQARRVLDRIVGYKISPFLWKKVKRGLSAGRVQSVAVRIIIDRENEIRAFVPEEYWTITAQLAKEKSKFEAHFYGTADGKKTAVTNEDQATQIVAALDNAAYVVSNVKKGTRKKQPSPPFTTSTMQQEASRKLNFNAQKTMRVAQGLYEGVELQDQGATGLITYMRTDSLRISEEARKAGCDYIRSAYGDKYLPEKQRYYKKKSQAQDAHEAIRPTDPMLTPDMARPSLTNDQYKLYKLIWERFIASLMECCTQNTVNVDITAADYMFKASGYTVKFDGYTALYEEGKDEEQETAKALPALSVGDELKLKKLTPDQHFTQPPARYTEATLIKALEENGIGRPSTYAATISTITSREYIEREKKSLKPTPLGETIDTLMREMFPDIVDIKFTAKIEKELDEIEEGKIGWVKVLDKFYGGFDKTLKTAEKKMDGTRVKVPETESDVVCEKCGKTMVIRSGRFGKFLACPGFPECKNTKPIVTETPGLCPKCSSKILLRKSSKGNKYFACEKGKDCGFMTWDTPTDKNCPNCGKTLFKRRGGITLCLDEKCGYQKESTRRSKTKENKEDE